MCPARPPGARLPPACPSCPRCVDPSGPGGGPGLACTIMVRIPPLPTLRVWARPSPTAGGGLDDDALPPLWAERPTLSAGNPPARSRGGRVGPGRERVARTGPRARPEVASDEWRAAGAGDPSTEAAGCRGLAVTTRRESVVRTGGAPSLARQCDLGRHADASLAPWPGYGSHEPEAQAKENPYMN